MLVWYLTGSHYQSVGSGVVPVMVGITYTLITVRVGLGWGNKPQNTTASMHWARTSLSLNPNHGVALAVVHRRDNETNAGESSLGNSSIDTEK